MALVSYSDSEASDSEQETKPTQPSNKTIAPPPPKPSSGANFHSIVDRGNPRKIRVALPDIKPESSAADDDQTAEDGPARKRAKIGGGKAFSGFNSLLPAPKRAAAAAEKDKKAAAPARKIFSLKTGAAPGFDREADADLRSEWAYDALAGAGDDETIPKAGSLREESGGSPSATRGAEQGDEKPKEEVKLKGNPMMFKPLSVGRASQKKKKQPAKVASASSAPIATDTNTASGPSKGPAVIQPTPPPPVAPKPKISLFSLSSEESTTSSFPGLQAQSSTYEPLVFTTDSDAAPAGPQPDPQVAAIASDSSDQTLDNIADDLNLSRAQRRQLFGRNADPSKSRILHFNTDKEYIANQELAHQTDHAAAQHNPVRAIAPGKHSLQQLVNAASTQKEALEESFATGRRNKKEAGSKYGW
ncbi:PRCC domain-containing protein [Aspergillus clavatus NRRL 1]|uniref:Mitotic checkpoint regulator, MAD2B-interacting-domain-containing protein n=1 Tax=Aspergillus clavatus (strain ATCC 1007 / CBS 513.65 / DSM 816 / NCTC 3887 / NRRL 1 / QM 1276 / 107) TaxID=344612 RepID=A1C6Q0_ASPCL|nr:uncharacterized protein ACLA_071040 [Aspergillus clavatus NRRL 1]EAW14071.1 conserved hypothetical protein [Aspergillus clavatus NRRL 1]